MPGELFFGFDPSLTHFGYAVAIRQGHYVTWCAAGVVTTKPSDDARTKTDDTRGRVEAIAARLRDLVLEHGAPAVVAVEALALPLGRTSLVTVSALGRTRGLVDMLAVQHGLTAREFQPQALKQATTGRRDASKELVGTCLVAAYPELGALFAQLRAGNREHAADACAAIHAALTAAPHQEG